jgi:hypothetical protein
MSARAVMVKGDTSVCAVTRLPVKYPTREREKVPRIESYETVSVKTPTAELIAREYASCGAAQELGVGA